MAFLELLQNYVPQGLENFGEEINHCHPRNAKIFERIEHSGIR